MNPRWAAIFAMLALAWSRAGANAAPRWATAILPSGTEVALEIAADELSRQRGYMFRESVGSREGMLFIFDQSGYHGFWMRDCKVSLDILWLDERLKVVDVAERVPPCPPKGDCPTVVPLGPARYVLELQAGAARREKIRRGDAIVIFSEPPLP